MAVPPPSPPAEAHPAPDPAKGPLRERLRAARHDRAAGLGEDGARAAAGDAAALLLPHVPAGAVVAVYLALSDELDPAPLTDVLHARGQPLALPCLLDDTVMEFRAWTPGDPLTRGPFRLRQPVAEAAVTTPDIIILPLLGFDRTGGRIGQGASHYDRALVRYPGASRVGFAWAVQEVADIPRDPWDQPLHAIVTEREWIVAR